jgi:hypothetical protein
MLDELAQSLHFDARDRKQGAEALAAGLKIGTLDAVRAFDLVRVECVVIEAAAPGGSHDIGDRRFGAVSANQITDEVRMIVSCGPHTHHC